MRPASIETPPPLPPGLLPRLAAHHRIALFLDYDGTISEITPDVSNAQPVEGAIEVIQRLSARPDRFRVILISGRQIDKLARLTGVSGGITFVGNHGLEVMEPGRGSRLAADPDRFMPALDRVRDWMAANVPPAAGFVIEDKGFGVALHYRLAEPGLGAAMRRRMRDFVGAQTPALGIREGKMVIEAAPREANKGTAAMQLMRAAGDRYLALYFGDDLTDEDAFFALRETGVSVKVCAQPCPSWARYRIASPAEVVAELARMAASVGTALPVQ